MAMKHSKLYSLLAGHVLDALDSAEQGAIQRHLGAGCARCDAELGRLREAGALLSLGHAPLSPKPSIKAALMKTIAAPAPAFKTTLGHATIQGDRVATAKGSEAQISVGNDIMIALIENSVATIKRGVQGFELFVEKGGALIGVRPGTPFFTRLSLGAIAVRGTYYYVESRGPKHSYICLCEGWIGLQAPGLKTEMKNDDHVAVTLELKAGKTLMTPASAAHPHPDMPDYE